MSTQTAAPAKPSMSELDTLFARSRPHMEKVAAKHVTPERLFKLALLVMGGNDTLKTCTPESFMRCLTWCAELGLEPTGTFGGAHLVPRYNSKLSRNECTLVIDYRGLVDLARRSGELASVEAGAVYEGDDFHFERGLTPALRHIPTLTGERGPLVAVWSVIAYKDGTKTFEVMRADEVEDIRDRNKNWDKGPWKSDHDAMAKKTVVRRALNLAPKSKEVRRAIEVEEEGPTIDAAEAPAGALPETSSALRLEVPGLGSTRTSKLAEQLRRPAPAEPAADGMHKGLGALRERAPAAEEPPPPGDADAGLETL